jgi:hypothetical protein
MCYLTLVPGELLCHVLLVPQLSVLPCFPKTSLPNCTCDESTELLQLVLKCVLCCFNPLEPNDPLKQDGLYALDGGA